MRVAGRAGVHVRKFSGVGLAHDQRAGLTQQRHHMGIPGRLMTGIDGRVKLRRMVGTVEDILHPHRDSGQQATTVVQRSIGAYFSGIERDEGLDVRLQRLNALQDRFGDDGGGRLTLDHGLTEGRGIRDGRITWQTTD